MNNEIRNTQNYKMKLVCFLTIKNKQMIKDEFGALAVKVSCIGKLCIYTNKHLPPN